MNIYLLSREKNAPVWDGYDRCLLDSLWDFTTFHNVYNLLDMDPNNISDNILILLLKNDLYELESKTKSIEKCNNKRIIVLYHYKCLSAPNGYKSLEYDRQLLIDKLGFQPQNILYITQLKPDQQHVRNVFGPLVKVTYFDKWLEEMNRYQIKPSFKNAQNHFAKNNLRPDKKFSLLIRRYEDVRLEVMCELISKNLLDDFYYTFAARGGYEAEDIGKQLSNYLNNLPERYRPHHDKILQWAKGIPYEAETIGPGQTEIYDMFFSMNLGNYCNHCKIMVVLETHFHDTDPKRSDHSIITEKTYRAMLYKKPFIIISQHGTLATLRECGYKTFGHVINESYDHVENVDTKLNLISTELDRIRKLDDKELQYLLDACQENIEHNYNLLLKESFRTIPKEYSIPYFINS